MTKFGSIDGASKQTIFHFHYFYFRLAQYASRFSLALDHWHICFCRVDKATPSASRLFDLIYCNERDFDWYSNQRYKDSWFKLIFDSGLDFFFICIGLVFICLTSAFIYLTLAFICFILLFIRLRFIYFWLVFKWFTCDWYSNDLSLDFYSFESILNCSMSIKQFIKTNLHKNTFVGLEYKHPKWL